MTRDVDYDAASRAIDAFLRAVGAPVDDDPELRETADRVARAFGDDLLSGYREDPAALLARRTKTHVSGMVLVVELPVATLCPHHLLPATGRAHVGYLPTGDVVGLGAIGRLVDCFARRFALQEALGQNVVDALMEHLDCAGAGCVLDLEPTCVTIRGERRHGTRAITHAWAGVFEAAGDRRAELLAAVPRS